jgi:hypothetical protein
MLSSKSAVRVGASVVAAAAVAGVVGLVGAGTASAATASLDVKYSCTFPVIGNQTLDVKVQAQLPDKFVVNQPSAPIPFAADAAVPASAASGLGLIGAKTLTGSAIAGATVQDGNLKLGLNLPASFPNTAIPSSGTFVVHAAGTAPGVGLPNAGTFALVLGGLQMKLTPLTADGKPTGLGTFSSTCTVAPGQQTTLAQVPVSAS